MTRVVVPVTDAAPAAAALTTALSGADNDLTFTARAGGQWGNDIQIAYVDPGGVAASPSVVVAGFLITVNLGRAASAINTTAQRVITLIRSSADARALVDVELAVGSDGSGLVTAMAATPLTGGIFGVEQPTLVNGDAVNGHYFTGNDGRIILEVVATTTSDQTVTIRRAAVALPGANLEDEVVTIPAGETWELGPFPASEFNQNSAGDVYFDPSWSDVLDFRAYRVTRAV